VANDPHTFLLEQFLRGHDIFSVRRIPRFVASLPKTDAVLCPAPKEFSLLLHYSCMRWLR